MVLESTYPRPRHLIGYTEKLNTEYGNLYVTINEDAGEPREIFIQLGKAGSIERGVSEGLGRMITLLMKYDVPLAEIVEQLRGIREMAGAWNELDGQSVEVWGICDGVARVLSDWENVFHRFAITGGMLSDVEDVEGDPVPEPDYPDFSDEALAEETLTQGYALSEITADTIRLQIVGPTHGLTDAQSLAFREDLARRTNIGDLPNIGGSVYDFQGRRWKRDTEFGYRLMEPGPDMPAPEPETSGDGEPEKGEDGE